MQTLVFLSPRGAVVHMREIVIVRVYFLHPPPCWQARYEIVKECLRIRHEQPQIHNEKTL